MQSPILTPSRQEAIRLSLISLPFAALAFLLVMAALNAINGEPFGWTELKEVLPTMFAVLVATEVSLLWWPRRRLRQYPQDLPPGETVLEKALVWWQEDHRRWSGVLVLTDQRLLLIGTQIDYTLDIPRRDLEIQSQRSHTIPSWRQTELRYGDRQLRVWGWVPQAAPATA